MRYLLGFAVAGTGTVNAVLAFICLKCFSADRTGVIYKGYAVNQI